MYDTVTSAPLDPDLISVAYRECWDLLKPHLAAKKMGPLYRAGFDSAAKEGRLFFVRDENSTLLAFLQVSEKSRLSCLSVDRLAVREGYQRQGIGTVLLAKAWSLAQAKSRPLRLRVANTNAEAILFYTRLGLQTVESSELTSAMEIGQRLVPPTKGATSATVMDRNTRKTKPRRQPGLDLPSSVILYEGLPLTVDRIHAIPVDQREPLAQFLFQHFRDKGFPYPKYPEEELRKDWQSLQSVDTATLWDAKGSVLSTGVVSGSKLFKNFFPHFFECTERGAKNTFKPSMLQQFEDDNALLEVIRNRLGITFMYRGVSFPFNISGDMLRQGMRSMHLAPMTSNFRASVAKAIYEKYLPRGGIAYDFSVGFGQRLLGFLAAGHGALYLGCDPWRKQIDAARAVHAFVGQTGEQLVDLHVSGSETFRPEAWQGLVDVAFSSPPYFEAEVYDGAGAGQAYAKRTYAAFLSEYWAPTVDNMLQMLRPGGRVILNIAEVYKKHALEEDMLRTCVERGLVLEQRLEMSLSRSHLTHKVGTDSLTKTEPMLVLRKE